MEIPLSVKKSVCEKNEYLLVGTPRQRRRSACDEKGAFSHGNLPVSEEKVFVTNNETFYWEPTISEEEVSMTKMSTF